MIPDGVKRAGSIAAGIMLLASYLLFMRLAIWWGFGTAFAACALGYACATTDVADIGDGKEEDDAENA